MSTGSLTVVGVGIAAVAQITPEAHQAIELADEVVYVVADVWAVALLKHLHPSARNVAYEETPARSEAYERIASDVVALVESGQHVCFVVYGHPGVFVRPTRLAVSALEAKGLPVRVLPGISADACLYADLGVDPGNGIQMYEATEFLRCRPRFDTAVGLILWQIGGLGCAGWPLVADPGARRDLANYLTAEYGTAHRAIVYEASVLWGGSPKIDHVELRQLAATTISEKATLYVPPVSA